MAEKTCYYEVLRVDRSASKAESIELIENSQSNITRTAIGMKRQLRNSRSHRAYEVLSDQEKEKDTIDMGMPAWRACINSMMWRISLGLWRPVWWWHVWGPFGPAAEAGHVEADAV